ncbi:group II intron maturase-specific domain-containing protein [Streptomyces sp. NPDC047453]|uniref:group II intron maturase-specific domain-containing protein n=1 Tax=Streptomyces sp. NPDC047453 TaxID=3154812 RepID=UPI0034097359
MNAATSAGVRVVTSPRGVGSARGAVLALRPARFPGPPSAPAVPVQNQSLATLLEGLNRTLTGWATYFRHGAAKRTFNAVDHHVWHRVAIWLRRKHGIPSATATAEPAFQLRGPSDWQPTTADTGQDTGLGEHRYSGYR